MAGLADLSTILARFLTAGKQIILKSDFVSLISSILAPLPRAALPPLVWVDAAQVRVEAIPDSPASLMMSGFPNILNPSETITADLTDGSIRTNVANATMLMGGGGIWGVEKPSQWYAILATALDNDTTFGLSGTPWLRVKSQADQVISFGTNLNASVSIGYGFTANQFAGGRIYVCSGASKGLLRAITANSNGSTVPGTVTYSGTALSLAQGDWFIILPATNFRWLGDIFNDADSNLSLDNLVFGRRLLILVNRPWVAPFTRNTVLVSMIGGGGCDGGGCPGHNGGVCYREELAIIPGTLFLAVIGAGGSGGNPGGGTALGSLKSVVGGGAGTISDPDPSTDVIKGMFWGYGIGGVGGAGVNGVIRIEIE